MDISVWVGSLDLVVGRGVKVERLADNIYDIIPKCSVECERTELNNTGQSQVEGVIVHFGLKGKVHTSSTSSRRMVRHRASLQ